MKKLILALVLLSAVLAVSAYAARPDRRYAVMANNPANRAKVIACINRAYGVCLHTSMATVVRSCDLSKIIVKYNRTKLIKRRGREEPIDLPGQNWLDHATARSRMRIPAWRCVDPASQ